VRGKPHPMHFRKAFDRNVEQNAPLRRTVTQEEVGKTAAFLLSDAASGITGQILYVDSGYVIMGSPTFESPA
jgi:enoyl-[acyl-carrier-protein] reductase (NADH)